MDLKTSTYTFVVLVCLVFVAPSRQETPQYSYECQEDGTVVLHGFSKESYIDISKANGPNTSSCIGKVYKSDAVGHVTIDCSTGVHILKDRNFTFQAVDTLIDAKTTTVAPTTTTKTLTSAPTVRKRRRRDVLSMGQRFHNYVITCKMISIGVVDHVIGHVGVQNIAPLPDVFNSVGSIEMRFKSEAATENSVLKLLPDISSVYIGDKFYMYLKYMGSQAYTISPQACTAYGGDKRAVVQDDAKKAELWKYDTCATNTSVNYHLMHNFMQMNDSRAKIVYAEMFGFNFVDDGDITIECNVQICRDASDAGCVFRQSTTCPTKTNWSVRKRRSPTGDNTKVYGTLKVFNRNNSNSAGINHVNWMCLVLVQLVFLWKRE